MAVTYEEPEFVVISKHRGFDIRLYSETVRAQVRTTGQDWRGSSGGFRRIAGYIFGGNNRNEMIAMTAPVHIWEGDDGMMMAFTMPSEYSKNSLPLPNNNDVQLERQKGGGFCALKFSGLSGPRKSKRLIRRLTSMIEGRGWKITGPALLAIYDNPLTTLPFLRRNEILIPIDMELPKTD